MKNQNQTKKPEPVENKEAEEHSTMLQEELQTVTNNWKRALADYQNLEKRVQEEKRSFAQFAARQIVNKILPGIDLLELAQEHLKDKGLALAIGQFHQVLKDEGLEQIEVVGVQFDPVRMECVETTVGENDQQVVRQVRAGYRLGTTVIRPAQVVVSIKEKRKESAS